MTKQSPPVPVEVAGAFAAFPTDVRQRLEEIRRLIFTVAAETPGVGPLTETLKWGEPAYLTQESKSGTTIRLGWIPSSDRTTCAVLFNCQTTLVETFREQFPERFGFQKNRAILLDPAEALPVDELSVCLEMALTYHQRRKTTQSRRSSLAG
ncbi:MAG: DUF1801 domain-containing protein [Thermomicrobiales bacterium]|nr:DUF1801 domain-containing protein [Thermomicrobiales bacterium]MCO5223684.1 DUF1801 domain-containing protein [Thermomicrobiales bacterium]